MIAWHFLSLIKITILVFLGDLLGDLPADASEGKLIDTSFCYISDQKLFPQRRLPRGWLQLASLATPPSRWWQPSRAEEVSKSGDFSWTIIFTAAFNIEQAHCLPASGNGKLHKFKRLIKIYVFVLAACFKCLNLRYLRFFAFR